MKKIGILLSSPKEIGGIFQYSLSIITSLENLQKKKIYNIQYFYTDTIWEKYIPKNSKKFYIKKRLFYKLIKKILSFFFKSHISLNKNLKFLNEEVSFINKSNCELVIFPSQNIISYLIQKKVFQQYTI